MGDWPKPKTGGMRTVDTFAPWITYHYPYTDVEAATLGFAVIDATCNQCLTTQRITMQFADDPKDDPVPPSGISEQRSLFTMDHLHGGKTSG